MAQDKTLRCRDCGQQFIFTVGEQEFYTQKGFDNDPVRCAACRRAKKTQRSATIGVQTRARDPYADDAVQRFRASFGKDEYGY